MPKKCSSNRNGCSSSWPIGPKLARVLEPEGERHLEHQAIPLPVTRACHDFYCWTCKTQLLISVLSRLALSEAAWREITTENPGLFPSYVPET